MKITIAIPFVLLLAVSLSTMNCSPDNDFTPSTEETLTRNGWGVDYYMQQQNISSEFDEYFITFRNSGTINCRKGTEVISGTWNMNVDMNQSEMIVINIATSNPSINKLNGSWSLKSTTASTMTFEENLMQSGCMMRIKIKR